MNQEMRNQLKGDRYKHWRRAFQFFGAAAKDGNLERLAESVVNDPKLGKQLDWQDQDELAAYLTARQEYESAIGKQSATPQQ